MDNELISVLTNNLKNYVNDKKIAEATNNKDVVEFCETRIVELCSYLNKNDYLEDVRDSLSMMKSNQTVNESLLALKTEQQAQAITQSVSKIKYESSDNYFDNSELVEAISKVSSDNSYNVYKNLETKISLPSFKGEKDLLKIASSCVTVNFYNELKDKNVELEEEEFYMNKVAVVFDGANIRVFQENDDDNSLTQDFEQ